MQLSHEVVEARWAEDIAKWRLTIRTGSTTFTDEVDVVLSGMGALERWALPEIPGIETFAGRLLHSAQWDEALDVSGKRIAVIGVVRCLSQLRSRLTMRC